MAKKLAEAAGSQKIRQLQVDADYSLATMRKSILAIAEVTSTQQKAQASIAALESFMGSWRAELKTAGLLGAPVVVHLFQQPLIAELGFDIRGMFGPGPVEAAQITKLTPTNARFVVDNWHNEAGGPLRETMKEARYVSLINFPGPDGTKSLLDVLADNRARLKAAAGYSVRAGIPRGPLSFEMGSHHGLPNCLRLIEMDHVTGLGQGDHAVPRSQVLRNVCGHRRRVHDVVLAEDDADRDS